MELCKRVAKAAEEAFSSVRLNHMPFFGSSKYLQELTGKQFALMEKRPEELGRYLPGWKATVKRFSDADDAEGKAGRYKKFTNGVNRVIDEL